MKEFRIIKTDLKNNYLLSPYKKQILIIHPYLNYIIGLNEDFEWIEKLKDNEVVDIGNNMQISKEELLYYKGKYLFIKEEGYFRKIKIKTKEIDESEIIENIKNIKAISFEITESCNLKCAYCIYSKYYSYNHNRSNKIMDISIAKEFIDYVFLLNNVDSLPHEIQISFFGGEPLLNFNSIREIVSYSKKKYPKQKFRFAMTTNATLLDKYIEFLVENKFNVLISIDGNDYDNRYRVFKNNEKTFDIIKRNINLLRAGYPIYFENHIEFNTVLHNQNENEVLKYFQTEFNKEPRISLLQSNTVIEKERKEFYEIFGKDDGFGNIVIKNRLSGNEFETFFKNFGNIYEGFANLMNKVKHRTAQNFPNNSITCIPFQSSLFVTVNNMILPCEKVSSVYSLGEIIKKGNRIEIDTKSIAFDTNKRINIISSLCGKCATEPCPICMHIDRPDDAFSCEHFKSENDFANEMADNISKLEKKNFEYFNFYNINGKQ